MAALRLAARRLALHASVVSPAEELLLPRISPPVLSRRRFTSGAQISVKKHPYATALDHGEKEHFASRVTLLDKKEELYDLLAEVERNKNYMVGSVLSRHQNRVLLQNLSVQVDVRPDDTEWRLYRRSRLMVHGTRFTLFWLAGIYLAEKTRNRDKLDGSSDVPEKEITSLQR